MLKKLNVKRYVKDESGVSLIIVVMTLFVLSIIGVTLATVTFANVKLTTTDREYQSTYYIAEAGVNETYAEIKKLILESYDRTDSESGFYGIVEPALLDDISDSTLSNFERNLGEQPEAQISITKIDDGNPRRYQISSVGKIGQRERTVTKEFTVNWVPKSGPTPMPQLPEGVAAIIKNNVNLSGSGTIDGDLYLDSTDAKSIKIDGGAQITSDVYLRDPDDDNIFDVPSWMTKPEPKEFGLVFDWEKLNQFFDHFPIAPNLPLHENVTLEHADGNQKEVIKNGNLFINDYISDNYQLNLDRDYYFKKGNISGNNTLIINIGHEDRNLVFDELEFNWGHLKINGTGTLNIYVKNKFTPGGGNVNKENGVDQLTVYYEGTDTIDFSVVNINANIFVKKANVRAGGGGNRTGLLVSGGASVVFDNNAHMDSIIVAPYAEVKLTGGKTNGVVIADKLEISGGTILNYKQVDTSEFPFDFITVPNEPAPPGGGDTGGLLTPKPNVE